MAKRRLPPLNPLRNFEAAARHGSFVRAAEELNVTPAAVSRQVLVLEQYFGQPLFVRNANVIELTDDGAALLPSISTALDMVHQGVQMITRRGDSAIRLCTYGGFLMHWLIPRLGRFRDAHPEIGLNLMSVAKPKEFEGAQADIMIKYGSQPGSDHQSQPILPDIVLPACSPALAESQPHPLPPIENLAHHTLLRSRYRRLDWPSWLEIAGAPEFTPHQEIIFRESGLANQAASQGLGIAIAQWLLIENELHSGRLVMPFKTALRRPADICMITSHKRRTDRHVALVCEWIEREARDTVEGFGLAFTPSSVDTEQPMLLNHLTPPFDSPERLNR